MVTVGKKYAKALWASGAEVVIAITHNRHEGDRILSRELFGFVNLILGGHGKLVKVDKASCVNLP